MNPLLDPAPIPDYPAISPADVAPALDTLIARQAAVVARIVAERPDTFDAAWLPLERADTALDALWATVSQLHSVADTPELRSAHADGEARLVENAMRVAQNRDLFEIVSALTGTPRFATLPEADRAAVTRAVRDFTLAGVALPPAERDRFGAIQVELAALTNAFGSAVLDATQAWSEPVADEAALAGLSPADKDMLAGYARAADLTGWLVTLQQPSVTAILTFAEDRELRFRVYEAYGTRASDRGPDAGRFDNGPRIARILELRHEAAALLGFADPVEWSLATKMAGSAAEVIAFLRDLAARARPAAERDLAELRAFAAEQLGIADLQPWDVAFASDRLRRTRYAVAESEVRAFFPVERVMAGWEALLGRLFGIRLIARADQPLWHPDARYFDVADENGIVFAGLYLDLHARAHKRGGAWMAVSRALIRDGEAQGLPIAYLTCNFAPTGGTTPSLLSHHDVQTLLHETGHCLHHLFTRVPRPGIGSIAGTEWDAVELPSQLMEDFAWDASVLTGMSGHYETAAPLPADLFDRMLAARRFQAGMMLLRQVDYALFDLLLHLGTHGHDPVAVHAIVRDEVAVLIPPAWHRFAHGFSHIFAGGYAAGYYSYLWAELLAADAFGRFVEAGVVDRATGEALRDEILSRGAVRPAIDGFRAFRGRDPDPQALLVRHGLA